MLSKLNFFKRDAKKPQPARLAVFGKHPSFDDHIDILGGKTELISGIRALLYTEGIRGNIDSGAWDAIAEEDRVPFNHGFLWLSGDRLVAGRLWTSTDGKGRSSYPMVLCIEMDYAKYCSLAIETEQCLDSVKGQILETSVFSVLEEIAEAGAACINDTAENTALEPVALGSASIRDAASGDDEKALKLRRLLYHLFENSYMAKTQNPKMLVNGVATARMPSGLLAESFQAATETEANVNPQILTLSFMRTLFESKESCIIITQSENKYVDLIIGSPSPSDFYCLRAGLNVIPLTTEIPYDLSQFDPQINF